MLRKPGHKFEKALFLSGLVLLFSSLALVLMHHDGTFILSFVSGLGLLLAGYTYGNISMRRKSRNTEQEMDVADLSPDEVFDVLMSFFSKRHGYNKMRVLDSSRPAFILVKLNSWIGMGRGLSKPPGTVRLRIRSSDTGSNVRFEFDFSSFRNVIYAVTCIFMLFFFDQILGVTHTIHSGMLLYSMAFGLLTLFGVIMLLQAPFVSALEVKTYLRGKIRECLTQCSRKSCNHMH